MEEKFLRIADVMDFTGLAKSTVWAWVKEERLPTPIKLSSRVTVWKQTELDEWMTAQSEGILS